MTLNNKLKTPRGVRRNERDGRGPAAPRRPRVPGLPGRQGAAAAPCSRLSRDVAHSDHWRRLRFVLCAFGRSLIHSFGSMSRPPAAAPGQDAGGQGRGEGRGGHRRRDTLDRVWHYKGFASPAWTPQGKQHTQKAPSPRASVSPSENEAYPSGAEDPGPGLASPAGALETRRGREEGARAPWRRPREGRARARGRSLSACLSVRREPPRLRGGRDGHIFHGYAIPRLGVYSEHVHTHGENGTELMRARLFIYP